MKEELSHLILKYSSDELSLKEQVEFAEQMSNSHNNTAEKILYADWKAHVESDATTGHNLEPVLHKVHHIIRLNESNNTVQINWLQNLQRVAAILLLPLLLAFSSYYFLNSRKEISSSSSAEIQCPMGVRTKFTLPDGSTGYLNSGSSLKYLATFNTERKVDLIGEAFFQVVHDEKRPFHVNTNNLDIKVLGTTFNVIANKDEKTEEIILETGKVDIASKEGTPLATLAPNEKLMLDIEKRTFSKNTVDASQYISWKEGRLVFRNETMKQMASRISRWYNVDVVVDDQILFGYTFHATFIDEPLDEVLKLLALTTPISFKEEKRELGKDGVYLKRKIYLGVNKSKLNQFK